MRPIRHLLTALCLVACAACTIVDREPVALGPEPEPEQAPVPVTEPPDPASVVVYVPFWDQARGFATALANTDVVTDVSPWWFSVWPDGTARPQWEGADYVDLAPVRELQQRGIRVVPTIANHRDGEWESGPVQRVLRDPAVQDVHVRSIVELVVSHGFDGIDVDYEDLRAVDRDRFSAFVARLGSELRALGKIVTVDVHPKVDDAGDGEHNEAQDFAALGAAADQVRLMAYDLHYDESEPGPIAPTEWVEEVLAYTLALVPAERVVLGVPLFGYDWSGSRADGLTWEEVSARAAAHADSLQQIGDSGESAFRYEAAGDTREVWYYSAADAAARVGLAGRHRLGGVFFWRLGGEDPALWPLLRQDPQVQSFLAGTQS